MRTKLAYVVEISSISDIPGKDNIKYLSFVGLDYNVISNISQTGFKIGDKVIYIEYDTYIPASPTGPFEFLRSRCYKESLNVFKIGAMKMGGVVSYGLCMPLSILTQYGLDPKSVKVDQDLTEALKIVSVDDISFEPQPKRKSKLQFLLYKLKTLLFKTKPLPPWPTHILPKTDEVRVENLGPIVYERWRGHFVDITVKEDGQSVTVLLYDNYCYICSRNVVLYYDTIPKAKKYITPKYIKSGDSNILRYCKSQSIVFKMMEWHTTRGSALQFELCGPGIQGNKMGYNALTGKVFNAVIITGDTNQRSYFNYNNMTSLCKKMELDPVDAVAINKLFRFKSKAELKQLAGGKYPNGHDREGIVIRASDNYELNGHGVELAKHFMASFKVINDDYALQSK